MLASSLTRELSLFIFMDSHLYAKCLVQSHIENGSKLISLTLLAPQWFNIISVTSSIVLLQKSPGVQNKSYLEFLFGCLFCFYGQIFLNVFPFGRVSQKCILGNCLEFLKTFLFQPFLKKGLYPLVSAKPTNTI